MRIEDRKKESFLKRCASIHSIISLSNKLAQGRVNKAWFISIKSRWMEEKSLGTDMQKTVLESYQEVK